MESLHVTPQSRFCLNLGKRIFLISFVRHTSYDTCIVCILISRSRTLVLVKNLIVFGNYVALQSRFCHNLGKKIFSNLFTIHISYHTNMVCIPISRSRPLLPVKNLMVFGNYVALQSHFCLNWTTIYSA